MSSNVIRQDVIELVTKTNSDELTRLSKELDELRSSIQGGVQKSLDGLGNTRAFDKLKNGFSSVTTSVKKFGNQIDSAADKITSKFLNLKTLISGVIVGGIAKSALSIVGERQDLTSQFEVLLGSAEKAKKRVEDLTDFAGKTPFTRDEIFRASKQLQVFTGDALSTGNSLKVIGDVAAGTGQSFEDVALWSGRLYDAMKSGRKVGEMVSRLQEMGAISGEGREEIEKIADATNSSNIAQSWSKVEKVFSRFDGTMEKMSNNLNNMLLSLKSFATNSILLPLGEGITQGLQPAIQKFREFRKENKAHVDAMGETLRNFGSKICVPLFNGIESGIESVIKIMGALKGGVDELEKIKGDSAFMDGIISAIQFIINNKDTVISALQGIALVCGTIVATSKIQKLVKSLQFFTTPLGIFSAVAFGLFMIFKKNGGTFQDIINGISNAIGWCKDNIYLIVSALGALGAVLLTFKGMNFLKGLGVLGKGGEGGKGGGLFGGFFDNLAKLKPTTILKAFANLAIIIGGMSLLAIAFAKVAPYIADIEDFTVIVKAGLVITALGIVGAALSKLGEIAGRIPVSIVAKGLANMAIMIGGLTAVLWAMNWVLSVANFDFSGLLKIAGIIALLGTVGSVLAVFAGIVGMIPIPTVLLGLANIALVLNGITLILAEYAALSKIPGFTDFIKTGGEVLVTIFNIIGKIVGSLVGGAFEGIASSLPKIGESLADFGENIKPLFEAFKGVDMSGIGTFFGALGAFMLQLAGDKLISFFTGGTDLGELGTQLNTFAENAKGFFEKVATFPENGFTNATKLFECLSGLGNLPGTGGLKQWFQGEIEYDKISEGLKALSSENVSGFFAFVQGVTPEAFSNAEKLFECLNGIGNLPATGGLKQWFTGEIDYAKIAAGLESLSSEGVKKFFEMAGALSPQAFENTTALFNSLAGINGLPSEGGFWQWLTGEKTSLSELADNLAYFGEKTPGFFEAINGLNLENLSGLWESLKGAEGLTAESLKGVSELLDNLTNKAIELPKKMGDGIKEAGNSLSEALVHIWQEAARAMADPVNKIIGGANWILKEFGSGEMIAAWQPYAKGTDGHKGGNAMVNDGRGAELVQMPNGRMFIPKGRNVFLPNAPAGMKVLPAEQTAKLLGKKSPTFHYAKGIGDIDLFSYYDNASGLVNEIKKLVSYEGMSGFALHAGKAMVSTITGPMESWVEGLFSKFQSKFSTAGGGVPNLSGYVASAGVNQWKSIVEQALKMEGQYSEANVRRTLYQMQTESSGNPAAINNWDINAKRGTPSKGLMQVIDPTFKAYARPGFDSNIYDPMSNVLASIRYAKSRYGSLENAYRGVGYANGVGTVSLPEQSDISMRYTPENSYTGGRTEVTETNNYSPVFNLTINGATDTRTQARQVKAWIQEAMDEMFASMARKARV